MKIDIIYRCCGKETDSSEPYLAGDAVRRASRPSWFDKRKCYKSAWDMTDKDPSTFSMHVIWSSGSGGKNLMDYIEGMRVSDGAIYCVPNDPNNKYHSIQEAYDLADKLTGDWIYFVEDDYLHAPDAAQVMLEGANKFELLSLYDHLDRYTRTDDRTIGKESVDLSKSCHWRTAESTCCTYAVSRERWAGIEEYGGMRHIAKKNGPNDRSLFYDLIEHGLRLLTPIPARSTHCMQGYMSPMVDWDAVAEGIRL